MAEVAEPLRHHHFSFVRAAIELPGPLRGAWERYLAFEGGPDDERHFALRLRELTRRIREAANARGLGAEAEAALGGRGVYRRRATAAEVAPAAPTAAAAPPPLDDWVAARCATLGIDRDFQSEADWLAEYRAEFALDLAPGPQPATAAGPDAAPPLPARRSTVLRLRLQALNRLASALARPPATSDALAAWLTPELAGRLAATMVDGRPLPLLSLQDLIDFVRLHHHRWWTRVPRLGARRAGRLMAWLAPLAAQLGQPLPPMALQPLERLGLARRRAPGSAAAGGRFGLVPLDRLAVPPALAGATRRPAGPKPPDDGALTDLQALQAWLRRHEHAPHTHASYARVAERFYLWCLLKRGKPLAAVGPDDLQAYADFIADPPADWVQRRRVDRDADEWRPFKGPLAGSSRRLELAVVSALLAAVLGPRAARPRPGALAARAEPAASPAPGRPAAARGFDEAQWGWLQHCWRERYAAAGPAAPAGTGSLPLPTATQPDRQPARAAALRRLRLVLEIGAGCGLRLGELASTRRGAVQGRTIEGRPRWVLALPGPGAERRELPLSDEVVALLDQHHADMQRAGTAFDGRAPLRLAATAPSSEPMAEPGRPGAASAPAAPAGDPAWRPLVGALRRPPPRWRTDALGVARLDAGTPPQLADRHGALDPTALYQSLKRFFADCAAEARRQGAAVDAEGLATASTRWLRRFFARRAAAAGVGLPALQQALGHARLQSTAAGLDVEGKPLAGLTWPGGHGE